MSKISEENVAHKLCALYDKFEDINFDAKDYSTEVMQAFLEFGTGALHHQEYCETVEYGSALGNTDDLIFGFKIKGKNIFLGHILNELEPILIPDSVRERYPDLTQKEWEATIRITTLFIQAFSPSKPYEG